MNASGRITRRGFVGGALLAGIGGKAFAQGYAGLSESGEGFAPVVPGRTFAFPADHGPHPEFRIEWWYVTANLSDANGNAYGAQWTLFRQAIAPGGSTEGWANQQIWMGHAAVTRADTHRVAQAFARGGIGQAGVEAQPFQAWIDAWEMRGIDPVSDENIAPLALKASGTDFSYALRLGALRPLVLQGDGGYSRKSLREQASYYYSQPHYSATGVLTIDDKPVDVTGMAWLDREWSSQPLASDQSGWDWLSLHFKSGDKLMLYRMRQSDGQHYGSGKWILPDGKAEQLASADITMTPLVFTEIEGRKIPTTWRVAVPKMALSIECTPLNVRCWMGTSFPYWEGPIRLAGSHTGVGYLEMTGY
ncbi:lipocalin-like domain-containing protein [Bradyrhizobium sp. CB3481]|uniref:lipocalin-like domain-containing protein n=1 Tax=Bradyrhizobium sp. CB3481 TaxID=3039158 RepID=UPI0024B25F32|nr:lipocalin-like domain-containing protein [Bradyrhizobium sp. CB3481]WFU17313.1 lipocalin-like domain-containing protein [Bradyrhizobium sp. CB3481]